MIGNMEILFLAFTFALCGNEKHVLVRGLLFDSGPLSSNNDISTNTDNNSNNNYNTNYNSNYNNNNNNNNNDHSAADVFQNRFISGPRDNRPMTYVQRDYVTSSRSKNHNNVDNAIRRRQHRHKQSVTMNEQSPLSKEHKIGDNMPLREQDGDRKLSGEKLQGQMMNYDLEHQAGTRSGDIKNTIDSKYAPDDINNNNNIIDDDDDDDDGGGKTSEDQKQRLAKERKERMKKYWEKRKQFYEKRKKIVKEKKTGSDQRADDKSKRQRSSGKMALASSGEDGAEKNSAMRPDGANARNWRQSESENHSVQYREHLKRQIYRTDDDDDDDDDDNDVSMASEHHHYHHHHHHGDHKSGRHDRRCDAKICRNDGICNEALFATGGVANNVTSQKKCLCRLGTAGQHCEKTDVSVKYPKFHGFGFIAFPTLRDSYREFSFRLEFRPEADNGLLLFASDHVDASHDFFSVNLIDGRVEFRFDCGTGLGRIRTENQVELRTWNSLEILRKESDAELRLNSDPVLKGRSKGNYTKMTFRDHLFLGGHRNMTHAARYSGAKTGFVGCIRRLEVKDRKYDMRRGAFVGDALYGLDVEECDGHECERVKCHNGGTCINKEVDSYVCLCRLGNVGKNCEKKADVTMPSFSDMSYLQYVGLRRTVLNFLQIEIVFLPRSSSGMLLFNGFSPDGFGDFVSLALINSTVEFRFDLGTGPAVIKGRNSLALNEWHTLKAWRDGKNGHLQVDGDMEVTGTSRGAFTQLTLALDLFVGGHRNFDEVTRNAFVSSSFDGCIQKLVINERPIKLIHESLGGVNIGECSAHPCSSKRPCLNGGKCIAILDKYKCDCLPGFQDDHCQGRAARYRYRYKRSSNQDNLMPKFEGNSYMLITRYDVVSKTRGSSCDLEMRIKAQKNTSGLIFFVSNQIDDTLEFPATTSPTTTTTTTTTMTQDTTKATTTSNTGNYDKIYPELFNEDLRNGFPFKSADEDFYPDDVVSELELSRDVKDNPQSVTKDDDGGYEDDEMNDAYYYHGNAADDVVDDVDDVESHGSGSDGKSGDFFVVGLVDGFVTVEFSLGEGSGKMIFNKSKVDDGVWHSVRVHRRGRDATLEVDGSEIIKVTCPGRTEQLFTDGTVYIGGLPNVEQRTSGRYSSGFHGCIGHISLSSGQLVDLFKMADVASNVSLCQEI